MRVKQEDSQYSKNNSGDQRSKGLKTPRTTGLNALLETVRRKMAYTIRGI